MISKIVWFTLVAIAAASVIPTPTKFGRLGIVGGQNTTIDKFPYLVSIQLLDDIHFCSGIILNSRNILASASCFDLVDPYEMRFMSVLAGVSNITGQGVRIKIANFYIHEKHVNPKMIYDVAIVELAGELEFSKNIRPALLTNDTDDLEAGTVVNATGYGAESNRIKARPGPLKYAELEIVDHEKCANVWRERHIEVHDQLFCAGDEQKNVCEGDGAVTVDGILIGYPSLITCGDNPSLFTKISSIRSWIKEKVGV